MVPVKNSGIIEEGAGVYADDAVGIHEIIIHSLRHVPYQLFS